MLLRYKFGSEKNNSDKDQINGEEDEENQKLLGHQTDSSSSESTQKKSKWSSFRKGVQKRMKRDGMRLFLLVIINGLYLYLGGLIFFALEESPQYELDHKKHVEILLKAFQVNALCILYVN